MKSLQFDKIFSVNEKHVVRDKPFRKNRGVARSVYLEPKVLKTGLNGKSVEFRNVNSIIREDRPVPFEQTVHNRAPTAKEDLRYSKFSKKIIKEADTFCEEIDNSKIFGNNNGFEKNKIASNKIREIFKEKVYVPGRRKKATLENAEPSALDQMPPKPILTKQEKLD